MDDALRAGVAIHNAGNHHAAHDAWEDRWLALESGTADERFLHGLIQFTAAVHHARRRNWSGAVGLAESAREYLDGLAGHRGVNVGAVRAYLAALAADPELIERRRPLALTVDGAAVEPADLGVGPAAVAAEVLAEAGGRYDADVVAKAVELAREERAEGVETRFIALVMDFVAEDERRGLIYRRLADHVARLDREARDVEDLFD